MKKHLITLLTAAGIFALALPSAKAAQATTTTNSLGTSGYALGITFDTAALWSVNTGVSTAQTYGGGHFSSDGDYILQSWGATGGGQIAKIDKTDGSVYQSRSGLGSSSRSFVNVGGYFYATEGTTDMQRWTNAENIGTDTPADASFAGTGLGGARSSASAVIGGVNTLFIGENGDSLRRYTVNGDGSLTAQWGSETTFAAGTLIHAMTYVSGRGLYVATDNAGGTDKRLYHVSDSGTATQVSGSGDIFGTFQAQNFTIASFNYAGTDYFLSQNNQGGSGFTLFTLANDTTLGAWDAYSTSSGSGFTGLNTTFTQTLWGDGTNIYVGAGQTMSALGISEVTPIPEPSTYAMLALGLAMSTYGLRVSRKRKVASATTA